MTNIQINLDHLDRQPLLPIWLATTPAVVSLPSRAVVSSVECEAEPPAEPVDESCIDWDTAVEVDPCPKCGGLDHWRSMAGNIRCRACNRPSKSNRVARQAARIRRRYPGTLGTATGSGGRLAGLGFPPVYSDSPPDSICLQPGEKSKGIIY